MYSFGYLNWLILEKYSIESLCLCVHVYAVHPAPLRLWNQGWCVRGNPSIWTREKDLMKTSFLGVHNYQLPCILSGTEGFLAILEVRVDAIFQVNLKSPGVGIYLVIRFISRIAKCQNTSIYFKPCRYYFLKQSASVGYTPHKRHWFERFCNI